MPSAIVMLQHRVRRIAPIAGLLVGVGACATTLKPPAVNSPASSRDGVEVAVLRQACSQTEAVDEVPTGSVDETVEIQVRNGSPEPVTVHPDRFRLFGTGAGAPAAAMSRSADTPVTVAQGGTQTIELQFTAQGGLECTREMRLDPNAGITLRDSPVAVQPVPFRPL
jgi:hypothetical protein